MSYPRLKIDLDIIESNAREITGLGKKQNIEVFGVIKAVTGIAEVGRAMLEGGCTGLASSRINHLAGLRDKGIKVPLMLVRIPMKSEVKKVVECCDISLHSEFTLLQTFNDTAVSMNKKHGVILMADIGDLREGFWSFDELLESAQFAEEAEGLELLGIGTNVGCYGSVVPTKEKLEELVILAEKIEEVIGRRLKYISGGATSSVARLLDGDMPERINMLRIGEGILFGNDLVKGYGYEMPYINNEAFVLEAEVVEVKKKPSHPIGSLAFDAFGRKPKYEDKGIRKRALVAVGKADYADESRLMPRNKNIVVVGASSDHTILDVTDLQEDIKVGDIIEFVLDYQGVLYATTQPHASLPTRVVA